MNYEHYRQVLEGALYKKKVLLMGLVTSLDVKIEALYCRGCAGR